MESNCTPNSSHCLLCVPVSPRLCPAPHCVTPDDPVPDYPNLLLAFSDILFSIMSRLHTVSDSDEVNTELILSGILGRRVLERFLSGEFVGKSVEAIETLMETEQEREELANIIDSTIHHSPVVVSKRTSAIYEEAIRELFGVMQQLVDELGIDRAKPTQSKFCLHSFATIEVEAKKERLAPFTEPPAILSDQHVQQPTLELRPKRVRDEVRAAWLAGRIVGGMQEQLDLAAKACFMSTCLAAVEIVQSRRREYEDDWKKMCCSDTGRLVLSLLTHFTKLSNDPPAFRASAQTETHLRQAISVSPPPRSSMIPPTSPSPRKAAFLDLHDRHPFTGLGRLVSPRICAPNRCSGQPPIVKNYEMVENCVMDLLGWRLNRGALQIFPYVLLKVRAALSHTYQRESLRLETDEQREDLLGSITQALGEAMEREDSRANMAGGLLIRQLFILQRSLFHIQKTHQPCLCDLTHLVNELEEAVSLAKADFERESSRQPAINVDLGRLTSSAVADLIASLDYPHLKSLSTKSGWIDEIPNFLAACNQPLDDALQRSPTFRLEVFDVWRSLALQLGLAGVLEITAAIESGDYRDGTGRPVAQDPVLRGCVDVIFFDTPFDSDLDDLEASALAAHRAGDLKGCLLAQMQLQILSPVNWKFRLDASAIRLRIANDTDQKFQYSRAIYDCTMAIHYGPPNFKAYYRRGLALAHLKMWDKAVLDFERALALEPHDVFLKERLRLAKLKRS